MLISASQLLHLLHPPLAFRSLPHVQLMAAQGFHGNDVLPPRAREEASEVHVHRGGYCRSTGPGLIRSKPPSHGGQKSGLLLAATPATFPAAPAHL